MTKLQHLEAWQWCVLFARDGYGFASLGWPTVSERTGRLRQLPRVLA